MIPDSGPDKAEQPAADLARLCAPKVGEPLFIAARSAADTHLGLIAMEENDLKLARGHFGRAYELCLRAFEAAGSPQPVPYELAGNHPFHEAAKGLVHCLLETGRRKVAQDVCRRIAALDPTDPLGIARLLERK